MIFATLKHCEFNSFMTRIVSGNRRNGKMSEADKLSTAKSNLDTQFDFVGFHEFFSLSAVKLSALLGTSFEFEKDVNVGRYDLSKISPETIASIVKLNRFDMQLYKYAIRNFL